MSWGDLNLSALQAALAKLPASALPVPAATTGGQLHPVETAPVVQAAAPAAAPALPALTGGSLNLSALQAALAKLPAPALAPASPGAPGAPPSLTEQFNNVQKYIDSAVAGPDILGLGKARAFLQQFDSKPEEIYTNTDYQRSGVTSTDGSLSRQLAPLGTKDGKVVYSQPSSQVFTGNPDRVSYVTQGFSDPGWIREQTQAGKITESTITGADGKPQPVFLVDPAVASDPKFAVEKTGDYRGSNDSDTGVFGSLGISPGLGKFISLASAALTGGASLGTGALAGAGSALGNATSAYNLTQGVGNNNWVQAATGALGLAPIAAPVTNAVGSGLKTVGAALSDYVPEAALPALTKVGTAALPALTKGVTAAGVTALGGGDATAALANGLASGAGAYGGEQLNSALGSELPLSVSQGITQAGAGALSSAIKGGDIGQGALLSGIGGFSSGLGRDVNSFLNNPAPVDQMVADGWERGAAQNYLDQANQITQMTNDGWSQGDAQQYLDQASTINQMVNGGWSQPEAQTYLDQADTITQMTNGGWSQPEAQTYLDQADANVAAGTSDAVSPFNVTALPPLPDELNPRLSDYAPAVAEYPLTPDLSGYAPPEPLPKAGEDPYGLYSSLGLTAPDLGPTFDDPNKTIAQQYFDYTPQPYETGNFQTALDSLDWKNDLSNSGSALLNPTTGQKVDTATGEFSVTDPAKFDAFQGGGALPPPADTPTPPADKPSTLAGDVVSTLTKSALTDAATSGGGSGGSGTTKGALPASSSGANPWMGLILGALAQRKPGPTLQQNLANAMSMRNSLVQRPWGALG